MLYELHGEEPVDKVFLDYLEKYRQHFARAIGIIFGLALMALAIFAYPPPL